MSKSKGNVLDPLDLINGIELEPLVTKRITGLMQPEMAPKIEEATRKQYSKGIAAFGTDALRFTFTALASTGRDIRFDLGRIEGYRNFCNKLWNATRYVLMNTENAVGNIETVELSLSDKWIISRLQQIEEEAHQHIKAYRFDLLANSLYDFTWHEYCDWYLELSKPILQSEQATEAQKQGTRRTLVRVLETLLRLLHPITPFITEELWQRVAPLAKPALFQKETAQTIMLQPYPQPQADKIDKQAEAEIEWIKQFVLGVRRIRAEMDIAPNKPLPVLLQNGSADDEQKWQTHEGFITHLARLENVTWLEANREEAPESAIALVGEMRVLIPLAGLIDVEAELKRLNKEMEKLKKELAKCTAKLNNPKFTERAPAEIVEKERQRVTEMSASLQELETQAAKIRAI
jgi:valyl-tRNA synthetase